MWWPWVRQIFVVGYATFMIVAKVAISKSTNTNAISVVEKFQKVSKLIHFIVHLQLIKPNDEYDRAIDEAIELTKWEVTLNSQFSLSVLLSWFNHLLVGASNCGTRGGRLLRTKGRDRTLRGKHLHSMEVQMWRAQS
ncbi:hypothetical protein QQP08_015593 [Theobroma cacao]|nr:hypothetical protein QQP08_015593 [Theobroma cacao]